MIFNSSYYLGAVSIAPSAYIGIPYPHYPSQSPALTRIVPFRSGRLFAFLDDIHISKKIKNTSREMIFALPKTTFALPKMITGLPETIRSSTVTTFALPKTITGLPETIRSSREMTFGLPEMIFGEPKTISLEPNPTQGEAKLIKNHSQTSYSYFKIHIN